MKKIISAILVAMLLLSASLTSVSAEETNTDEKYIKIVYNLGISETYAKSDSSVTRGEFATMLVNLLNAKKLTENYNKGSFFDVDGDRAEAGSIDLVYNLGIMVDVKNGKFRPDDKLSFSEACEALVRLLGYKDMGEKKGFVNASVSLGIAKGIKSYNGSITIGNLCKMIYNSLDVRLAESKIAGNNVTVSMGNNVSLLKDYLDITEATGKVTAVKGMYLYGLPKDDLSDNQVEINNVKYDTFEYFTPDRLGSNVEFWYKTDENENKEIIYAQYASKNEEMSFTYGDIEDADDKYLEYKVSDDKTKKIKLSDPVILKNGVPQASVKDIDFSKKGTVKCVMENNTCIALIILEYKSYVVSYTDEKRIRFDYEEPLILNISDETQDYIINYDDRSLSTEEIEVGDVLSIAHDDYTDVWFIQVSKKVLEGKITTSEVRDGNDFYEIDGSFYKIDSDYKQKMNGKKENTAKIDFGVNLTYYIDFMGEIAGTYGRDNFQYGYMSAAANFGKGFEDDFKVKILTNRHKAFTVYGLDKNVTVNGKKYSRAKAFAEIETFLGNRDFKNPAIVKFKENAQKNIYEIVTARRNGNTTEDNVLTTPFDRFENSDSWPTYYETYSGFLTGSGHENKNNMFFRYASHDVKTVALKIPDTMDEDDFEIGVPKDTGIENSEKYDVMFYDCDDFFQPTLLVYFAPAASTAFSETSRTVIGVEKVVKTVDNDGNTVTKINGYRNGTAIDCYVDDSADASVVSLVNNLKKGDFILAELDGKNYISLASEYFTWDYRNFDYSKIQSGGAIYSVAVQTSAKPLLAEVWKTTNQYIRFKGDVTVAPVAYALSGYYPGGIGNNGYITMYDGEKFSKVNLKDLQEGDLVFAFVTPGHGNIESMVALRDADVSSVPTILPTK